MRELKCDSCNTHLGWEVNGGPRNWIECDECHQKEEDE